MYDPYDDWSNQSRQVKTLKQIGDLTLVFFILYTLLNSVSNFTIYKLIESEKLSSGEKWFLGLNIAKSVISVIVSMAALRFVAFRKKIYYTID